MIVKPEVSFIDAPICFIASTTLTKGLYKYIEGRNGPVSLDASVLWELREHNNNQMFFLHFEWPGSDNLFTIDMEYHLVESMCLNNNVDTLGILVDFNIETHEAKNVIFIQGIDKGLENIIPHLTNYKTQSLE